jgi:NAD(P)H-hydrate epimerase
MVHTIISQEHGNMTILSFDEMKPFLDKATVIAIGPGLGNSYESIKLTERIIDEYHSKVPIVVDADGLLAINTEKVYSSNVVLTPHLGEFKRLTSIDFDTAKKEYIDRNSSLASTMNCIIHTKSAPSITSNGEEEFWLPADAPSLATAGSGDVLTGIITGIIAQGVDTFRATGLGAFLHREAAKRFEKSNAEELLTASKLIDYIDFKPHDDNWH